MGLRSSSGLGVLSRPDRPEASEGRSAPTLVLVPNPTPSEGTWGKGRTDHRRSLGEGVGVETVWEIGRTTPSHHR